MRFPAAWIEISLSWRSHYSAFTYVDLIYNVLYAINSDWWLATDYYCEPSIYFSNIGWQDNWCVAIELQPTTCKHEPECSSFSNRNGPLSSCCLGQRQISHSHNDPTHNARQVFGFTSESIFKLFTHSLAASWAVRLWAWPRLAFWQTMWWIRGHTWPLSYSLGDQPHFQGQEPLTSLFNQEEETRSWRWVYNRGFRFKRLTWQLEDRWCSR